MTTGAGLGRSTEDPRFAIHPATPERWADLERLFGARGACGGCWCMYWLLPGAAFDLQKGEPNRLALMARVGGGEAPGLVGYQDDAPVAWCAVGPRARYPRLNRSRILAPVDDAPVWSLVCLFVARRFRRAGWSARMVAGAVEHVRRAGGAIVEAYPVEPRGPAVPDVFAWTGFVSAYRAAGFVEVARRSPTRPIMRYSIA
jgi:GNAT superfamily N-acetyltransferase